MNKSQRLTGDPLSLADVARTALAARRRRGDWLPTELLGEPAWDILLVLAELGADATAIEVSGLCARCNLPLSTTCRWLERLQSLALVEANQGQRRVSLTKSGAEILAKILNSTSR